MPIEFRCTQCQKLLRTGDDTSGKQAKCPECGAIVLVPAAPSQPSEPEAARPAGPPPPDDQQGSPIPPGAGPGGVPSPYEPPTQYGRPPQYGPAPVGNVESYLVHAILCTIFCCLPFGIVAIVFAAMASSHISSGNYPAAVSCSNSARTWCWVAFWLGLLLRYLPFLFFMCAGGMAGGM